MEVAGCLLNACPDARFADDAAKDASLELQLVPAIDDDGARIGPAIFAIIELARPPVRAGLRSAGHDRDARHRARPQGRIWIIAVFLKFLGRTHTLMQIPPPQEEISQIAPV